MFENEYKTLKYKVISNIKLYDIWFLILSQEIII